MFNIILFKTSLQNLSLKPCIHHTSLNLLFTSEQLKSPFFHSLLVNLMKIQDLHRYQVTSHKRTSNPKTVSSMFTDSLLNKSSNNCLLVKGIKEKLSNFYLTRIRQKTLLSILMILLLIFPIFLAAKEINVSSSVNATTIGRDEEVVLSIEITSDSNIRLNAPKLPNIPYFSLRNISQSSSSNISLINRKLASVYSYTFDYHLIPQKVGNLKIPSISFTIDNQRFTTEAYTIRVLDRTFANKQPSGQSSPWGLGQGLPSMLPDFFDFDDYDTQEDIRIIAKPEKNTVYLGEPFLVDYKLITNQMVSSLEITEEKDFGGYGKSDYSEQTRLNFSQLLLDDQRYKSASLKTLAILPNREGEITLPQITATAITGFSGLFKKTITSVPAKVEVKPLPEQGKPIDFSGAVGHFTVSDKLVSPTIRLGEAFEYQLIINGRGNFNQFSYPAYPNLAELRTATPITEDQLQAGIIGKRTIKYLLIPKREGTYTLPGVQFNWFDPTNGEWRSFSSRPIQVTVKPGNVISFLSNVFQRDYIQQLSPFSPKENYTQMPLLIVSPYYWSIIGFILSLLIPAALIGRHKRLKETDPELIAQRRSNKILKKYLHQATLSAQRVSPDFYLQAEEGLMRYLSDKYNIKGRHSTTEKIYLLRLQGLDEELIKTLEAFLKRCQEARFMPGGFNAQTLEADLANLKTVIRGFIATPKKHPVR